MTRIISDNPQVTPQELVEELGTVGVNVTKRTVTNTLRKCRLQSYAGRKSHLTKRHTKARRKFANNKSL